MMELRGKKVVVVGLGKSGVAAARVCRRRGARVLGIDEAPPEEVAARVAGLDIDLAAGPQALSGARFAAVDVVVVSPGVPPSAALERAEREAGEVIGELELGARLLDPEACVALVGGTNGKSTVTALAGEMVRESGLDVFVGGNFGTPLCDALDTPYEVVLLEVSSFQAERVPTLHANVHALLNISEDHLDRYPDYAAYAEAKGNPFVNMTPTDFAVVPHGDDACLAQARRGDAVIVTFGVDGGDVSYVSSLRLIKERVHGSTYSADAINLSGLHNMRNTCAAIAICRGIGIGTEPIWRGIRGFRGLRHRHELVARIGKTAYYDDSKATNVGAAVAALRGLDEERAVLIAGGRDKHGSYVPLCEALRERGRALVLIGEAADRIAEAVGDALPVERAASMAEAVARATALAQPNDAVLLSPACSSFDMFQSYAARGDAFAAAVRALRGGEP